MNKILQCYQLYSVVSLWNDKVALLADKCCQCSGPIELIRSCVSSVLVALVHFGCKINCGAELHVGKENCLCSWWHTFRNMCPTNCKKNVTGSSEAETVYSLYNSRSISKLALPIKLMQDIITSGYTSCCTTCAVSALLVNWTGH